jgi:hypothetical protein
MASRHAALTIALLTIGCNRISSPTEPVNDKPLPPLSTSCPMSQKDEYGFCIPAPPPPPCSYLENGRSFPGCVPSGKPEIPSRIP